jgi:hypothetical protein
MYLIERVLGLSLLLSQFADSKKDPKRSLKQNGRTTVSRRSLLISMGSGWLRTRGWPGPCLMVGG